jgi:hypothetical protein
MRLRLLPNREQNRGSPGAAALYPEAGGARIKETAEAS